MPYAMCMIFLIRFVGLGFGTVALGIGSPIRFTSGLVAYHSLTIP